MIVDAGHAHHLWVAICGEMAGDVALTPLLLGLGVDELSAGAALVPRVKRAVRSLDIAGCLKLVDKIKHMNSPARSSPSANRWRKPTIRICCERPEKQETANLTYRP